MDRKLHFGITTRQDLSWTELVERWRHIEDLGFDSAWLPDHLVSVFDPSQHLLESWTVLAALATQTTRIRIGVQVTNILFRNPVLLAKQAVTLDHISNGRLELALGSGNAGPSYAMAGIDPGTVADRVARLAEVTEIIDQLLRGKITTYDGRFYRAKEALLRPLPLQQPRPPITIAAHRSDALKLTAAIADRWSTFGGIDVSPEDSARLTRERNRKLDDYCMAVGRDPRRLARSFHNISTRYSPWASVDAFTDFIGSHRQVGIDEFSFRWPQPNDLDTFEKIASDVMPRLRESAPV